MVNTMIVVTPAHTAENAVCQVMGKRAIANTTAKTTISAATRIALDGRELARSMRCTERLRGVTSRLGFTVSVLVARKTCESELEPLSTRLGAVAKHRTDCRMQIPGCAYSVSGHDRGVGF